MRGRVRSRVRSSIRVALAAMLLSVIAPKPANAGLWCWLFGNCGDGGSFTRTSAFMWLSAT